MTALTKKIAQYPTADPHTLKVGDFLVSRKRWTLDQVYRVSPEFITTRPRLMHNPGPYASILCKFSKYAGRIDTGEIPGAGDDDYCVVTMDEAVALVNELRKSRTRAVSESDTASTRGSSASSLTAGAT